jgi:fatty-acyl-CoA synthase
MQGIPPTLVDALEARSVSSTRGFRFVDSAGAERFCSFAEMHQIARQRAAWLGSLGLRQGDRLALVIPEGFDFVLSFLGATMAGVIPVPIFPRATFKAIDNYVETVEHIVQSAGAKVLLTMEKTRPFVEPVLARDAGLERIVTTEEMLATLDTSLERAWSRPAITPADLCFLQFTSGSTSRPKGVMVTHENLVANAYSFLGKPGVQRTDEDLGVSWLPLFHDMGLIGFVLGTIVMDVPVILLPTASFARTPRVWLETVSAHRATITYAPNFAYALIVKRLKERDIAELDLSCLRVAGCGAEPIRAQTLRDFATRLKPAGFSDRAFLPSYGMAEATLAITFHPVGSEMIVDRVEADALNQGVAKPAQVGSDSTVLELVSCGVPFEGHELRIVPTDEPIDKANPPALPERRVGQIVTRGPSVTAGYYQNETATQDAFCNGWLYTGDLGYVADGNLYICGRIKDLIIIRGANHYPQDIEWIVGDLPGVRRGHVVAFSVMHDGEEQLVIAAEAASSDAEALRHAIPLRVNEQLGLQVSRCVIVAIGSLPQTSSGKPQRAKTKAWYTEGLLQEHPAGTIAPL